MSASSTVALIEKYYAAFNAGDAEAFLSVLSEDVLHDVNQGGRERGKEAFRAFAARMTRSYREQIVDISITVNAAGSRAAAEYLVLGTYLEADEGLPPARGQSYELAGGAFFEVQDGHVSRVTNYYNVEDWLRQVR